MTVTLRAYAVVEAWHRSWCRRCGGPIERGEPAGFVRSVGPCGPCCYAAPVPPLDREALVLEHLHLVPAVARSLHLDRVRRPAAPVDRDDYLAAGTEALVRAASTWQAGAGAVFETYAWTAIGWAMRAEERSMRWHRQVDRRADRTLVSLHARHAPTGLTLADTLMDPASPHDDADLAVSVLAAVDRLRPTLRVVVRLCWLDDVPQKEAASRLGITQPAVAMRLQAARHVLARALAGLVEAEEVAA